MVKFTGTSMVRGRKALGSKPKDRERRFLPETNLPRILLAKGNVAVEERYGCARTRGKEVAKQEGRSRFKSLRRGEEQSYFESQRPRGHGFESRSGEIR